MLNRWQRTIVDLRGNVVPYAQLQILREQTQSAPTIYRDKAGTEAIPNAIVTANQNGYAYFYAPADLYRIRSTQPTIDWRDVDVGSAAAQQLAQQALDNAVPTYETLVDMQADTSQPVPTLGRVVNDSALENNGYYVWTGTAWDRAAYQPLSDMDVSIDPAPGKIPLAGGSGTIKQAWVSDLDFELEALRVAINRLAYGDGPYPTLDLRFAGATLLDPRVEFTRASTATGTGPTGRIYTAAIDEPRFTYDPMTGESLGLLVEGQGTNLLTGSDQLSVGWGANRTSWEPGAGISPDGKTDAVKIAMHSDMFPTNYRGRIFDIPATGIHVLSVFAKKAEFHDLSLTICTGEGVFLQRAAFDLESGGVSDAGDAINAGIERYPGGWFRAFAAFDFGPTGSGGQVLVQSSQQTGDGTSGILVWGAQLEEGTHPTSYIHTEGSQVTRAADDAVIPVGDWFNPDEGTFVVEGAATPSESNHTPLLKAGVGLTGNFGLMIGRAENGVYTLRTRDGGAIPEINLGTASGIVSIAASYTTGGNVSACMNGGEVYSAENNWAVGATGVWVGSGGIGGVQQADRRANGPIARITYYPRALSNEQLQALTS